MNIQDGPSKEKFADSKISGYVRTREFDLHPDTCGLQIFCILKEKVAALPMGGALNCYTFNRTIEEHFLIGVRVIEDKIGKENHLKRRKIVSGRVESARVRGFEGKKKKITAIRSKSKRNRSQ